VTGSNDLTYSFVFILNHHRPKICGNIAPPKVPPITSYLTKHEAKYNLPVSHGKLKLQRQMTYASGDIACASSEA
jgi:hypothetical protein